METASSPVLTVHSLFDNQLIFISKCFKNISRVFRLPTSVNKRLAVIQSSRCIDSSLSRPKSTPTSTSTITNRLIRGETRTTPTKAWLLSTYAWTRLLSVVVARLCRQHLVLTAVYFHTHIFQPHFHERTCTCILALYNADIGIRHGRGEAEAGSDLVGISALATAIIGYLTTPCNIRKV